MHKIKVLFVTTFFFLQLFSLQKHIIGTRSVGFFSNFFSVLMHLIGCKKNNLIPVVYWDHCSPYYVKNDDSDNDNNVWEYYFKPVSSLKFEKGDKIHRKGPFPGAIYIQWKMPNYPCNFDYCFRKYMNNIICENIRIKEHILKKIELFYRTHMKGKKIIGVHVRQSIDKLPESPLLDVDFFLKTVGKFKNYKILVASDNYSVIERFQKRFPGRVIFYDAHRSTDFSGYYLGRDKKDSLNAVIGEEVLIETILLSKCDLFVHSVSNVATAVLFFNPKLKHIFLNPPKSPHRKIDNEES